MTLKSTTWLLAAGVCGAAFIAAPASADLMQHVHTGSGSGALGGQEFVDADFTITSIVDTDNAESTPFSSYTPHLSSSIHIEGVGTYDMMTQTHTFVEHPGQWGAPAVAFAIDWLGGPAGLFWGPMDATFSTWDTTTELDTVTGDSFHLAWGQDPWDGQIYTTGGLLYFYDTEGLINGSFTATAIPAPGVLAMLAGAGLISRRRRRS